MSGNNIKVVCRFRPQNKLEIKEGGVPIIDIAEDETQLTLKGEATNQFAFDKVFGSNTPQQNVFKYSIKSIVDDVTAGYNGTVFAYGQTGSGKTFTMMGSDIDDEETKGIIPRIIEQIFESIETAPINIEFTVKVSYMEIYMERVRDLFNPKNDNLAIHEDKVRGVYVKDLNEIYVSNKDEVYQAMKSGSSNRVVAYTNMNAESSRSHSIVVITITQKNLDTGAAKSGKLYLVDLAGSEKVGKTGASGQTLEEAKKINKSLTALGMVINSLTDGRSSHIPYRDSKLTRILQESLGGNSRTTLIINCSPSSYNEAETISTLRFGMRAKSIKNKAKVNADLSPAELKALLKRFNTEAVTFKAHIAALENEAQVWRSGKELEKENWVSLDKISKGDYSAPPPVSNLKAIMDETSRPSTPSIILEPDEREELLKHECELSDQIAEKENKFKKDEDILDLLKRQEGMENDSYDFITKEHEKTNSQRVDLESKIKNLRTEIEMNFTEASSLEETNSQLLKTIENIKVEITTIKNALEYNPEKMKADKMRVIMKEINSNNNISQISNQVNDMRKMLTDSQKVLDNNSKDIFTYQKENQEVEQELLELDDCLKKLHQDYSDLLDKTIAEEQMSIHIEKTLSDVKDKLEIQLTAKKENKDQEIEKLKQEINKLTENVQVLSQNITLLKEKNNELQVVIDKQSSLQKDGRTGRDQEIEREQKAMSRNILDFETMRKALMKELQVRSEEAFDLESEINESQRRYNYILKSSANQRQHQQRMSILEHNFEHLTQSHKSLLAQNAQLKAKSATNDRKMGELDTSLKILSQKAKDSYDSLMVQRAKQDDMMKSSKIRLEKSVDKEKDIHSSGRIIKPLRGGGAKPEDISLPAPPKEKIKKKSWGFFG